MLIAINMLIIGEPKNIVSLLFIYKKTIQQIHLELLEDD